jgi:hypothetical protein
LSALSGQVLAAGGGPGVADQHGSVPKAPRSSVHITEPVLRDTGPSVMAPRRRVLVGVPLGGRLTGQVNQR